MSERSEIRNAAFAACPDTGCDWSSFYRGWLAAREEYDYAALEAECERLRVQVAALQSDANSWQSGYDKGREDGAKAAEGWKAQHARDSAELRRLCSERDGLWRIRRHVEADRDTANAISAELRAERDALATELDQAREEIEGMHKSLDKLRGQCAGFAAYAEIDRLTAELAAIKGQEAK